MSITTNRLTLEEYLNHHSESDKHYELVAGNLSEMPPESPLNAEIAIKLLLIFAQYVSTPRCLRCKDTEIVVSGSRTTVRLPDLMVLTEELANILYDSGRSTIMPDMPPPALVVEVVSPGKVNQDRDYRFKRCSAVRDAVASPVVEDKSASSGETPDACVGRDDLSLRLCGVSPISDTTPFGCKVPSGRWRNAPFKKRSEYAARGIKEYWIVDPQLSKVTILVLNQGLYDFMTRRFL